MSELTFETIEQWNQTQGAAAAIDRLIETLQADQDYHKLFDALLIKKKFEMGLPLVRPTSFDDVPSNKQQEFEESYVETARKIGLLFLEQKNILKAWIYLRTIHEIEPVKQAIEAMEISREPSEETEELLNIALHEGVHPVKGLEMMLATHGTCNTVTALDQTINQLSSEDRQRAVQLLVTVLYDDLKHTLQQEVQQKIATESPAESLRELMAGRDWLFEEGNYHIDVSHLNAVVRFSRFLNPGNPILQKAMELAEYGARLAEQFQYPGDPPFDDFYPAHVQLFKVLADQDRDEGLAYFQKKLVSVPEELVSVPEELVSVPEEEDKPMIAYVLVDLLTRIGRLDEAIEPAERYLKSVDESSGFSFTQLCQEAGRMDVLLNAAREKGDLVAYTAALLQTGSESIPA
jgi:tetratricopeptide (TPR) repeat protein